MNKYYFQRYYYNWHTQLSSNEFLTHTEKNLCLKKNGWLIPQKNTAMYYYNLQPKQVFDITLSLKCIVEWRKIEQMCLLQYKKVGGENKRFLPACFARRWAKVVLPKPGGPHRRMIFAFGQLFSSSSSSRTGTNLLKNFFSV